MSSRLAKPLFWAALAVPAGLMLADLMRGTALPMELLHPSGETSIRLMVLALLPGPLKEVIGPGKWLLLWLSVRRNLGVAAFAYALLHLLFYALDMGALGPMIDELELPAIWTGWLALAFLIPPAAISFDRALRALGRRWQQVQYLVYAAILTSIVHWLLIGWNWKPALIHLSPLILVWLLRALHRGRSRRLT